MTVSKRPIGELVDKCETWNPATSGSGRFDYIDLSSVDKETKSIASIERHDCSEAPSRARQLVETGDVLVATVRPNLNGVALVNGAHHGMTASTGYCVLRPKEGKIDSTYLFHWVKTDEFVQRMVDVATGANYPAVSDAKVKASTIPLPPLAEQKRIAAILDAADALRAKRRESLEQLDTLLQSTFLEMFGDPVTNPMGWEIAAVGDICKQIRGVTYAKSDARNTPQSEYSPILRANNIGESGQLLLEDFVFVPNSKISPQQRIIPNDVVVAASSGSISVVGKTAQVHDEFDGGFGAFCKVLRPHPEVTPRYFGQYFRTKAYRRIVSNLAAGANINNLKNEHLNNLQIPLPPIDLQKRFAAIVESVEQQKAAHRSHLEELDTLFASLQQRAFQGEL